MKKVGKIIVLITLFFVIGTQVVMAEELISTNEEARRSLNSFISCLNQGDEEVYSYIDTSNVELYNNVKNYLNAMGMKGKITKEENLGDTYVIKTRIMAQGAGWNVSGMTVEYKLKKIDGMYKITETDLFNKVGFKNVFLLILKIFAIVGVVIVIIVLVVVFIILKKSKKEEKTE